MVIYRIRNTLNGHFYIGKTTLSVKERFSRHKTNARRGGRTHLYRAMRLYGYDNFVAEEIESCSSEAELNIRESWHIEAEKPEYNMTAGGDGGATHETDAWKAGMKNRRSYAGENNPMFGKPSAMRGKTHTAETIAEQAEIRRKFWEQNDELRKLRSDELKGENNPMFGKIPANAKRFEVDAVVYPSLAAARRATGMNEHKLKKVGKFI
jgi:group I intron endonuclease